MSDLIKGRDFANKIYNKVQEKAENYVKEGKARPQIAVVLASDDPASKIYANQIVKNAEKYSLGGKLYDLGEKVATGDVVDLIKGLNSSSEVSGIIVQFPLPKHIDSDLVRETISPIKDVDSATSANIGKFYSKKKAHIPCTPHAMFRLLSDYEPKLEGKKAVILGRSHVVGKPLFELSLRANMTATICHSRTKDIAKEVSSADVVFSGIGVADFVKGEWLNENTIVIDAGINPKGNTITGDVDFESAKDKVKAITPVPGGVGPVTIAMLFENLLSAYESLLDG